jgi:hypothetical protein
MRLWDEPPDNEDKAFDTTEIALDRRNTARKRERDATSQRLLLPMQDGEPHAIFHGPEDSLLDRWPDHSHEGRVVAPQTVEGKEWPDKRPTPEIVARSVDWRKGECFDVMAVWDGQAVPPRKDAPTYGRIVADSSWHHYADYNLDSIVGAGAGPGSDWAKIQALYVNLAAWLAPAAIRRRFRELACAWVSRQISFEIKGQTDRQIGESTRRLLASRLPGAWRQEIDRDMLVENKKTAVAAKMPDDFADVLMGAYMRHYLTEGEKAEGQPDIVDKAIASYEDEIKRRLAALKAFRESLG